MDEFAAFGFENRIVFVDINSPAFHLCPNSDRTQACSISD